MSDYPRMLYQADGPHEIHGGRFDYRTVADDDELSAALGDGWHMTTDEARAPKPETVVTPPDAPPTRAELEQKATELGITFDGRTTDAKLAAKVAALVKE